MPFPALDEILEIVDGLIAATRKGDFVWKSVNPTTYVWDGNNAAGVPARLSLQRVAQQTISGGGLKLAVLFVLQVGEIQPDGTFQQKLAINGASSDSLNARLGELYSLIISGFTDKGLAFFKSIMSGIPDPKR
jgi:hypothetical protein